MGNSREPPKLCSLLLHAHVVQHDFGELGVLVLSLEGDQLVSEVHSESRPSIPRGVFRKLLRSSAAPSFSLNFLSSSVVRFSSASRMASRFFPMA